MKLLAASCFACGVTLVGVEVFRTYPSTGLFVIGLIVMFGSAVAYVELSVREEQDDDG